MPERIPIIQGNTNKDASCRTAATPRSHVYWLQGVTLAWMLAEFAVAAYAAVSVHSTAMLAFGADSLVELFSATVVLMQWVPGARISERRATRMAAVLLFALAILVAATAVTSYVLGVRPAVSRAGMGIALAALIVMPMLAWLKRREARRSGNTALAADAVQSAACAYLALIALAGLAANAIFHIAWFDNLAALAAVPVLITEGRTAWRGQSCCCC